MTRRAPRVAILGPVFTVALLGLIACAPLLALIAWLMETDTSVREELLDFARGSLDEVWNGDPPRDEIERGHIFLASDGEHRQS